MERLCSNQTTGNAKIKTPAASSNDFIKSGLFRPNASRQLTSCHFRKYQMNTQVTPCMLKVPSSKKPVSSVLLNPATWVDCSKGAATPARQRLANSAAINISTNSGCHGLLDNMVST